jgi:hypothetical protein
MWIIFIGDMTSPTNIGGRVIEYDPPIFIGYRRTLIMHDRLF